MFQVYINLRDVLNPIYFEIHTKSITGGNDLVYSSLRLLGSLPLFSIFKVFATQYILFLGEGSGTPLQYSCLENLMDGGACQAAIHGVAKSWTRLSDFTFTFHFHALEKKWQPTPVFLPGESQGRGSLVGCRLWGRTESETTEVTQHSISSSRQRTREGKMGPK